MCFQVFCTCCCNCLPPLIFRNCIATSTSKNISNSLDEQRDDLLSVKTVKFSKCKTHSIGRPTTSKRYHSSWSKWALLGQWLLLNLLWICVLSLAIPSLPPNTGSNNINLYQSSKPKPRPLMTTSSHVVRIDDTLPQQIRTRFVSNPTKRTFSILFPVPTVASNSSWKTSSSTSSLSSPSDNTFQQSHYKIGRSLRPVQPIPPPPPPPSQPDNVSTPIALVPKTNLSSSAEQTEVNTVAFHSLSNGDDTTEEDVDEPGRTTVLEIINRSPPLILNLPISLHASHIDPIVKRMLENKTGNQSTETETAVNNNTTTTENSDVENHLIRAGRQTHHDFIRRILNAVSVDSHNVNRYVHLVRPKGGRPQGSSDHGVSDLGLPPEIADEYIDGVNPPKFPGLRGFHPLIEKNDWRGPLKVQTKPKKPGPLVTVVDPDKEPPNLYKKLTNRLNQTFGSDKPKHFYPESSSKPMQPVIKPDSQQHLVKLQPAPRPPQYPPSKLPVSDNSETEDNLSLNNRNVLKTKLSVLPMAQSSSRDNAKHDLSLLLKQEFDAKNAELNQTKAQPMAISPAGQVLPPPLGTLGPKHSFSSSLQSDIEKLNKTTTSTTIQPSSVNPLSGPPYQLPIVLMNTSLTTHSSNNADMKEGVHYKTVSSLVLPPELTSTSTTSTSTERTTSTNKSKTTKLPKIKTKHKEVAPVTDKNTFVRVGGRRPRPKTTTTTTTTTESPLDNAFTPPLTSTTESPPPPSSDKLPSITSPKFVTTISNDVRFQVESLNRPNFTQYKQPSQLLLPPLQQSPPSSENINELELNSDESRVQFNTSINDMPNQNNLNISIVDDSILIVPTRPQSTGYRLTTERLAYILIGTCCGLAVLVLIIVAMSVRCKDMCSEYRSWKSAEKAALRWHRHNRRRGLTATANGLPYPMLSRSRFNLPRYFRTSIDNAKLRPPPLEPYSGNGGDSFSDKVLSNILQGSNVEGGGSGSGSGGENASSGACCHCIDCSSTWFFRNHKHGGWCCQRGYYQPPRRTKLPFGAASSVNTFMPRFAVDHNGDIKTNHHHLQHIDLAGSAGETSSQEPIMGRLQRNASEPNLDMCFSELNDNDLGRNGFDARHCEKSNSSGAIPVKVNMSSRFFKTGNHHHAESSRCHRSNGPLFCEIDDDEDDEDDEVTTDFSNVFETNFGDAPSRPPRKSKVTSANYCIRTGQHTSAQLYSQKCPTNGPTSVKHKSDQTSSDQKGVSRQHKRQLNHHHQQPEYYNPSTGRYYFDSTSIAKPLAGERNNGLNNLNGECSTIWINSSKLVDKLHRKHQASRRKEDQGRHRGESKGGHRKSHGHLPPTPNGHSGGDSSDGQHRQRSNHHRSLHHQQHRSSVAPSAQCHTHFDPGLFARLGLPGKMMSSQGNEHNFVIFNDTSERLI